MPIKGNVSRASASPKEAAKTAEAELRQILCASAEQEAREEATPGTLELLCEACALDLEARGKSPDSIGRAKDTKARLTELFGPRMKEPLVRLKEADLYAFRAWRVQGKAKARTVNRDFRSIRAMLKRAMLAFRFPSGLFLQGDETRVRWLRPEDEVLVFNIMPAPFGSMARLAAITIMRLSEIRLLRREQVDLGQGVVTLPRTKTAPRHVALNGEAQEILARQLERHKAEWVFPSPEARPYSRVHVGRVWRKAAKAAGLTDFHFHDLRHHGATMALNAGFTAPIVMALGGWKTERMMRRYAAVTDKTRRAAAEAVSGVEMLRGVGSYAIQR